MRRGLASPIELGKAHRHDDFKRRNVISVKDPVGRAGYTNTNGWFSDEGDGQMKIGVVAIAAALSTFTATSAQAQWADLNGQYRCVENCLGPGYAFITNRAGT